MRRLFALSAPLWLGSCAPSEPAAAFSRPPSVLPGPAPRGRDPAQAALLNRRCEGCHEPIAAEWRASLHARSHTDQVYQRAFAVEPLEFCQACHAPEADSKAPVPESAAHLGVGCVTCHVSGGDVVAVARPASARGALASRAHPLLRDASFATAAACGGCHEFAFPDRAARKAPELMQATLSEHAASPERDVSCADCHMPRLADGHRSHAFAGGRDEELVKSAVVVAAERHADRIRIQLAPRRLGHAFPTGDLFRRLEVSAEALGGEWQVVAAERRYLTRHWQRQPGPFGVVVRSAVADDRPLAQPVEVELVLGRAAAGRKVAWRVAYQRVEHPRSDQEHDSVVEGEIEIASGTFAGEP